MQSPELLTPRCMLRIAHPADAQATLAFMQRNQARFAPTDPPTPPDFYTASFQERVGKDAQAQCAAQTAYRFNAFLRQDDQANAPLIARINFTQISLGPFRSCSLGYSIDGPYEGQGLMQECVASVIDWVFSTAQLHRIQAGYLPDNTRSAALLERLGFTVIGLAPRFLFINGAWRDHVLTQKINAAYPVDALTL